MANPSKKSPAVENLLEGVFGRTTAITDSTCVPAPIGCGKVVTPDSFRDEASRREYSISGLCQDCQDSVFGAADEDDEDPEGDE